MFTHVWAFLFTPPPPFVHVCVWPALTPPPRVLRWQVGDLELAGRLGVKTLDDSYNVVVNGTTITNGILVHQATDQQGMILLSADKSRVYVIFRGTDMDKGTKAAIRDVCPSVVGFVTPTATDPTTASPSDDVLMHTGMCDLFDNMKEAVLQVRTQRPTTVFVVQWASE